MAIPNLYSPLAVANEKHRFPSPSYCSKLAEAETFSRQTVKFRCKGLIWSEQLAILFAQQNLSSPRCAVLPLNLCRGTLCVSLSVKPPQRC